jgi:flagellar export protein FliJ
MEKQEEVALQKAQLEVAGVRRRIDELTDALAKAGEERERAMRRAIPASRLQMMQSELDAAEEARQILAGTLETLRRQRDAQMKRYRTAHSSREMLSDLLTRQKSLYEQEQLRIQQKRLDDIAAARWQRN